MLELYTYFTKKPNKNRVIEFFHSLGFSLSREVLSTDYTEPVCLEMYLDKEKVLSDGVFLTYFDSLYGDSSWAKHFEACVVFEYTKQRVEVVNFLTDVMLATYGGVRFVPLIDKRTDLLIRKVTIDG